MTYTKKHQSKSYTLPRQSHTRSEQQLLTSGFVYTTQRTTIVPVDGSPRILPLDVNTDIVREPASQPAQAKGEAHYHSTPTRRVKRGSGRDIFLNTPSRTSVQCTHTGTQIYSSGRISGRGVQQYPDNPQPSEEPEQRPLHGVRQDKDRNSCDREASLQPAAVNKITRSQATSRKSARAQKNSADNRRTVPVQVWVSPFVKDELSRVASSESLSLSAAGAALLERGLQVNVDMQYSALLRPIIETSIARQMAGLTTRLTWLLVRIAFDSGQTRSIVTNIMGRQQGMTQPLFKTILEESGRSAKANIMRRTPQISELINSVEQWMLEEKRGEKAKKSV